MVGGVFEGDGVFGGEDDADDLGEGGVGEGGAGGEFFGDEGFVVLFAGEHQGGHVEVVGLEDDFAGVFAATGAAGDLG